MTDVAWKMPTNPAMRHHKWRGLHIETHEAGRTLLEHFML